MSEVVHASQGYVEKELLKKANVGEVLPATKSASSNSFAVTNPIVLSGVFTLNNNAYLKKNIYFRDNSLLRTDSFNDFSWIQDKSRQTLQDVLDGKLSVRKTQSFSDEEKENASVNGGYRYLLHTPNVESVNGMNVYHVRDYAINNITIADSTPVQIVLPAPVDTSGRARDFIIKVNCLSETIPVVSFVKSSEDDAIAFESADDGWAEIEMGINYFTFTETERAI